MRDVGCAALLLTLIGCAGGGSASVPAESEPPTPSPAASPTVTSSPAAEPTERPISIGERATLMGTVDSALRISLTPEAIVQVELRDVSRGDAEATLVAKHVLQKPGQFPIPFDLQYDPAEILPGHLYAVSARIVDRGQLRFVTDARISVLAGGATHPAEILVVPVQ